MPRNFLIYIDLGFISPGIRNRSLNALSDFVSRLGPHDATRVVLFDRSPHRAFGLDDEQGDGDGRDLRRSRPSTRACRASRRQRQTIAMIDSTPRRRRGAYVQQYAAEISQEIQTMIQSMRTSS